VWVGLKKVSERTRVRSNDRDIRIGVQVDYDMGYDTGEGKRLGGPESRLYN